MVAAKGAHPHDRNLEFVVMHIFNFRRCGRKGEVARMAIAAGNVSNHVFKCLPWTETLESHYCFGY
jgi:hypothetical protein